MEHAIETEVGRLAVFEEGNGPVLFFWPSLYLDHRSFEVVVADLASERRCVVVDGPGHGRSPGPGRPFDMATCARAAMQVLDALGIGAVDWVGNAWGGAVGVRAAIDVPQRIRSLIAIGTPMQPLSSKMRLQTRVLLPMLRLGMADRVGALVAAVMLPPCAARSLHEEVQRVVREAPRAGLMETIRSVSIRRADLVGELAKIACPTLFVAGGDDAMWPPDIAAAQASRIPGARSVTLPGAGHLGPLERPRETAGFIRAHLREAARNASSEEARVQRR